MGKWIEKPLSELAVINKDSWNVGDEEAQYIGLEHIEEGKLKLNGIGHSSSVASNKYRFREDNFLFGKLRPYFRKVVRPKISGICSTDIWVVGANNNVDLDFLFYLFASKEFVDLSYLGSSGTRMPRADWNYMKDTFWLVPEDITEQKAIAVVFGSLDDKIDLLQRQNQTLEALAHTLFQHWFDEEVEGDWEEKSLIEIADYLNGLACQKYPPESEFDKLPVLKIKELRSGISDSSDWASSKVEEKYIVNNGDVVFSWSGSLLIKIWDGSKVVLNQHLFKVTSENYPKWFYYYWTKNHLRKFISIAESKSTTMGHIKRKDLEDSLVYIPKTTQLSTMDNIISPMMLKIIANNNQLRTLESLRDTLLPKLLSGDVRVRFER